MKGHYIKSIKIPGTFRIPGDPVSNLPREVSRSSTEWGVQIQKTGENLELIA